MSNFIDDLDKSYDTEKKKAGFSVKSNIYKMYLPMKVRICGKASSNFLIKKEEFTKFLYIKNGCRVYFSDADILSMLTTIKDKKVIREIIESLKQVYINGTGTKFLITVARKEYEVSGIGMLDYSQVLTNDKDIDIDFGDLLILINLVIAKDIESSPLWSTPDPFFKKTICKYVSLLEYECFDNPKARSFLKKCGYEINKTITENYDTAEKRDEKYKVFTNYKQFEKVFEIC